jgi:hypothetical protein
MKRILPELTLIVIFITFSNASAQNLTIGLKGGTAISNMKSGSSDNITTFGSTSRFGADGGIYGEYQLSKLFSFSVGVEYSSQWGIKENVIENTSFLTEVKLDYLMLPVLARFNWKKSKRSPIKFYAAFGPFSGMLLASHPGRSELENDIKSDLGKFNAGVGGFIGISCSFSNKSALFIEGGGNYGFIPIQEGAVNVQNYTVAGVVTVGYAYTFQKQRRGWGR